jgi:hypothetical protein
MVNTTTHVTTPPSTGVAQIPNTKLQGAFTKACTADQYRTFES